VSYPFIYINHSCDPNVKFENNNLIIAIKDIEEGDELCFDYSTSEDNDWGIEICLCGTPLCRKKVANFKDLDQKLKDKYLLENIAYPFITKQYTIKKN